MEITPQLIDQVTVAVLAAHGLAEDSFARALMWLKDGEHVRADSWDSEASMAIKDGAFAIFRNGNVTVRGYNPHAKDILNGHWSIAVQAGKP